MKQYQNDPCDQFKLKSDDLAKENRMLVQMHKAISIIQFKLESQIIKRSPHFNMDDRLLLDKIDLKKGIVLIDGVEYPLLDAHFPTLDPKNPFALSAEEKDVIEKLTKNFKNSKRLQRHVDFLFSNGSMYLAYNSNLLYHGCIPLTEKGSFESFEIEGKPYKGKALCDHFERVARKAYARRFDHKAVENTSDYMWYLWCGAVSPLFGKMKMTTFERYFVEDKAIHKEKRNPYYDVVYDNEKYCDKILKEFDLNPASTRIL